MAAVAPPNSFVAGPASENDASDPAAEARPRHMQCKVAMGMWGLEGRPLQCAPAPAVSPVFRISGPRTRQNDGDDAVTVGGARRPRSEAPLARAKRRRALRKKGWRAVQKSDGGCAAKCGRRVARRQTERRAPPRGTQSGLAAARTRLAAAPVAPRGTTKGPTAMLLIRCQTTGPEPRPVRLVHSPRQI